MIARVALSDAVFHLDRLYDYFVPVPFEKKIKKGSRVIVPFGRANHRREAVVFKLTAQMQSAYSIKPITSVLDESKELAEIIEDSIYDTDEEYYDAIFKEYLKNGSEEEISSFLKSKMSQELNIDPKKFGVSVFLEERQNNFCVQKAVVTIFSSGIALDAKEMSEYLTELLGCSCVIVYE